MKNIQNVFLLKLWRDKVDRRIHFYKKASTYSLLKNNDVKRWADFRQQLTVLKPAVML